MRETVVVDISTSKLHIEDKSGLLSIYVPKAQKYQEMCYLRTLPTKIFNETMMGSTSTNSTLAVDPRAVGIISSIFMASDIVINLVLEEAGIIPVPYPDQYEEASQEPTAEFSPSHPNVTNQTDEVCVETEPTDPESQYRANTPGTTTSSNRPSSILPNSASAHSSSYSTGWKTSHALSARLPVNNSSVPRPITKLADIDDRQLLFATGSSQVEYRRLINDVITAAQNKKGGFPSQGRFNLNDLSNALPVNSFSDTNTYHLPFGIRSENQLTHDMKIGAAGELYVSARCEIFRTHELT